MAREIGKLVAIQLSRLPAGMHGDGGNLWLQVTPSGARTWVFRFRHAGKARAMGLGPLHTINLAKARVKARECRELLLNGLDPIEARKAKRVGELVAAAKMLTFQECAERYIEAHQAGWQNTKHAAQWPSTLAAYVYPAIGALPVQAVDVTLVMQALEAIWITKPETASRVRGRIESVLDWATARGYRTGENPARWRGHLENLLLQKSKVRRAKHHPALPYAELPAFITELRRTEGIAARALEFAILTAARTGEITGARWDEIDAEGRLWTIPAARMKAQREHRVPLSEAAQAILAGLAHHGSRIFPISERAMRDLLRKLRPGLTVHGMRSSFADWCTEQTSFPTEVREMALAHAVGSAVEAAYRRTDLFERRRALMEAWAAWCAGDRGKNVIELHRGDSHVA